ncbi:protein BTG2-like [Patiria miniata]|uniref:Anti-proliferative protein domain-containing protein n=1 Tax=Patiria miniata TaxID=46514 RepID=A0A913ZT75_PATMI|nr:protein BTG2-like [Patiria miniata]
MKTEVTCAVHFLVNFLRSSRDLGQQTVRLERFSQILINLVCEHYKSHWFPDKSFRGSGYRCLRINDMLMDPLVAKAGQCVSISLQEMQLLLPNELTVWVDPGEVSYRIGEEGSICVLYDGATQTTSETKLSALDLLNCKMRARLRNQNVSRQHLDTADFNRNDVTVQA